MEDHLFAIIGSISQHHTFPADIEKEILLSLRNPAASSCAEDGLLRVLRKYDEGGHNFLLVEEVEADALFRTNDGRIFQKGKRLRKRFQCKEVGTGRLYLFSPVYEVEMV